VLPLPAHPVRAPRQVVRKPWTAKIWTSSSRSSSRLAEQRQAILSEQRRSVSLSPARPPDPAGQVADENLGAEPAAESTSPAPAEPSEVTRVAAPIKKNCQFHVVLFFVTVSYYCLFVAFVLRFSVLSCL
jgi:hypothetical protein